MFSGGALLRFSLFALERRALHLGVDRRPADDADPAQLEGDVEGRRVRSPQDHPVLAHGRGGLAIFQAAGIAIALQGSGASSGMQVVYNPGPGFVMTAVVSLTAGTMFLMWLGEQVTERGIGNGVSLIIFAGIVAGLPGAVADHVRTGPQRRHQRAAGDGDRRYRPGVHVLRGVRRARPAPRHGELRAPPGSAATRT